MLSREKASRATPASAVPVPATQRGLTLLDRFDAIVAPATMPTLNGRNANPVWSGL
jgi:hypothetical protein